MITFDRCETLRSKGEQAEQRNQTCVNGSKKDILKCKLIETDKFLKDVVAGSIIELTELRLTF